MRLPISGGKLMDNEARLADEEGRICSLKRLDVLDSAPEQQFDKFTKLVQAVLDVPIAAVSLVDRERQWFKSIQGLDCRETPRSMAFCSHTIRSRDVLKVPDALLDPRFRNNPLVTGEPFIRAYLGAPLKTSDGYNLGSLCAIDRRARDFTQEQEALLTSFAALVVDELELRLLASRDGLTGVLTRRAFLAAAEAACAARSGDLSSLVVLDIDNFKGINDRYGHPAGDIVLREVATACRSALRAEDLMGRMGGEEFAVLLPGLHLDEACKVAERMRRTVTGLSFDLDLALRVTASFGIIDLDGRTLDAAMSIADTALYVAKRQGRNRCVTSESLADVA
jgi:diguanylate cyclase (GGDEF)-like protein